MQAARSQQYSCILHESELTSETGNSNLSKSGTVSKNNALSVRDRVQTYISY